MQTGLVISAAILSLKLFTVPFAWADSNGSSIAPKTEIVREASSRDLCDAKRLRDKSMEALLQARINDIKSNQTKLNEAVTNAHETAVTTFKDFFLKNFPLIEKEISSEVDKRTSEEKEVLAKFYSAATTKAKELPGFSIGQFSDARPALNWHQEISPKTESMQFRAESSANLYFDSDESGSIQPILSILTSSNLPGSLGESRSSRTHINLKTGKIVDRGFGDRKDPSRIYSSPMSFWLNWTGQELQSYGPAIEVRYKKCLSAAVEHEKQRAVSGAQRKASPETPISVEDKQKDGAPGSAAMAQ